MITVRRTCERSEHTFLSYYYNNSSLLFKTPQFCPISWVYSRTSVNLEKVWTVTLGRMGSLSLIFKRRAISLKLREKIQFFGSGDLAEFEKYANKRRKQSLFAATLSTRRLSLREDSAAHPTTTSPTTKYREREEVLPSDDDSSIPSDDECPKVTYEEEIHQSHTLNALDKSAPQTTLPLPLQRAASTYLLLHDNSCFLGQD